MIPNTPTTKTLKFKLKRSWGEPKHIGLTAIEIFNIKGEKIKPKTFNPDHSVIIDDHCLTCDENHMLSIEGT
jgi:hypothetical protein